MFVESLGARFGRVLYVSRLTVAVSRLLVCTRRHSVVAPAVCVSGVTLAGLSFLLSVGLVSPAVAQSNAEVVPAFASGQTEGAPATNAMDISPQPTGFWGRSNLLGDMGGLRSWLNRYGVTLGLQETSEYLGNVSGGVERGGAYDGLTQVGIGVDMEEAIGLAGAVFNVSGLQIHGRNLSQHNLLALQGVSGIEADATTRLWELWYQQSLLNGKVDVKFGQQGVDQEFMVSQYAGSFMNSTFGWPILPSIDMPAGGPAYPLSALGVRIRVKPSDAWTVLAGVFDGDPAGSDDGDPQKQNSHGTHFNVHEGALFIAEAQYGLYPPPSSPSGARPSGLPGTYKLGFWYNTQRFPDQRFDTTGLSLASPASTGVAASHRGDYGFYAAADQMVWRTGVDSPQAVGVFVRVMGAPGDRNLVDMGVNAGVVLNAPFKGRGNDVAGLALGYARVGSHVRDLDGDTGFFTALGDPVRSAETVVEATYQYQVTPWWQLQADVQYVFRPGGGIPNPGNPSERVHNEAVIGMRTSVAF